MEVWVDTKAHPNFEVSSLGNVRNKKTGRIMKQQNSTHGYKQLMIDHKTERVHRLVADSFYDGDRFSIYRCLHNQQQTHRGYHFEYVN